ncbi:hypothetical protein CDV55_107246 [Aspergillus turcosus]|nr:hypothetical protein CDV55_107246 [Aspergillus turcosus]
MIYFCLTVIGVCTAVLFIPTFFFRNTPQQSIEGRQGQDDGYTIDVNYGTSIIKGVNPEFWVTRTQGRLFVQAWHSSGTFWRKENPTPADMIYIGLNPSDMLIQRPPSQKEEDAFAERLRLIGAQDWEDEERCQEEYYNEGVESGQRKYRQSIYGWPSNGKGLWQCAILEKWQATFYEDLGDYPPLADVFKDQKRGEPEKKEL